MLRVAVYAAVGAAALATPPGGGQNAAGRFVVLIGSPLAPRSLDPALARTEQEAMIEFATCLKLLNYPDREGPRGTKPIPEAAEGPPRVSRDGQTYTFVIRRGLRFSDGRPLTAAAFAYSLQRTLDPRMRSAALESHTFDDIVGVRERARGEASRVAGITARGRTLTIRLTRRAPHILPRLAVPNACPVPVGFPIDPAGVEWPPGSGPYAIGTYRPGSEVTLVRNRYYRGSRPHRPDEIRIAYGDSADDLTKAVEQNRVDYLAGGPPNDRVDELARRFGGGRGRLRIRTRPQTVFLALNTRSPLFQNNAPLRRAIGFAVDRPALIRLQGSRLLGRPTDQLLPPSVPGFVDRDIYPLGGSALETARRLARGHLRSRRATLYVSSTPAAETRGRAVQEQLARIGLQVDVQAFGLDVLQLRLSVPSEPYDMAILSWTQDWPDPVHFLEPILHSRSIPSGAASFLKWNFSRYRDAQFDKRLDAASRLTGRSRSEAFARLEDDVLRKAAPIVPLYYVNEVLFSSARIGCLTFSPVFGIDFAAFCRK